MAGPSEPQKKPPLSCTSCRARKLKCDKQDPCHHCVRSKVECVFPARRRIQRPRKSTNSELLHRLDRLESIVGKVGLANLEALEARVEAVGARGAELELQQPVEADSRPQGDHAAYGAQDVRPLPQDNTASRYMSGEFWSSLCNEVEGLRQALEQTTDSDDEEDGGEGTTPESVGGGSGTSIPTPPAMLLGTPQTANLHAIEHPSPNDIRYLATVYFRNVDMHLKILHRPTVLAAINHLASHPDTASELSPNLTALFFAIYYAAVTSQTSAECTHALGRPRADLAVLFQAGVEQALARADYLNNTGLETLQALTIYTCCLRSYNGSRASWVLLGLLIRLAQALNIHQDGDGSTSRFSPFEAELRRRLWWQLIVLDMRAAEDRGTNTIIAHGSYDTRLPHNIDDVEFGPDTTAPLHDRPGPSDTTFSLFTAQSSGIFLRTSPGTGSEEETVRRTKHLESQYLKGADPSHVGSYLASVIVRLIILKMWLVMRYPLHPQDRKPRAAAQEKASYALPPAPIPDTTGLPMSNTFSPPPSTEAASAQTLFIAISIMQLSDFLETGSYSDRIRWWCETYVQWHPLAVALAELCTHTQGPIVERAWRIIEVVFPRWSDKIADAKSGSLWRPIRKLYKKAKAAREAALSSGRKSESSAQSQSQSIWGMPASASISALGAQLSNLEPRPEPRPDYMAIDPVLTGDMRPRLVPNMIFPESSAHTLTTSASSMPMLYPSMANADLNRAQSPGFSLFPSPRGTAEPAPSDFDAIMGDSGQFMAQALLAWPDISFDMPALSSTGSHDTDAVHAQAPTSVMADTMAGEGLVPDPALLETNMMNWSTWDEFILDTYADSTPPSGSGQSENN